MKKVVALALLAGVTFSSSAFADSGSSGVASDVNAVQKDNTATAKDDVMLAQDRAQKAKDKASGNWAGQAVDSMTIGADQVQKGEKGAETSVDKKVLHSDTNSTTGN